MTKPFTAGTLLYHSVHGLCYIKEVIKQKELGKDTLSYALVPKEFRPMKLRFTIGAENIYSSGFHPLVTVKEANSILDYLKKTQATESIPSVSEPKTVNTFAQNNQTWALAQALLSCSRDEMKAKEQKKRQTLDRSAKALVRELALVLEISIQEAALRVKKSLEHSIKINSIVANALDCAHED